MSCDVELVLPEEDAAALPVDEPLEASVVDCVCVWEVELWAVCVVVVLAFLEWSPLKNAYQIKNISATIVMTIANEYNTTVRI